MYKILSIIVLPLVVSIFTQAEAALPDTIYRVGATETPGVAWGVFAQSDYAYVADRSRLTIIDISIPSVPWVVSSISGFDIAALGVAVIDTVAYLNAEPISEISNILVVDPASPSLLGWASTSSGVGVEPKGISVVNNIAYQPLGSVGFWIVDVSDPSTPTVIDSFNTPGIAVDLFIQDTFVFVADYDSLQVINVANPTNPFQIGSIDMPNSCYDVFVSGNYAYVTCESFTGNDGSVQVVDITDPSSPSIVTSVTNISGDPFDLYLQGGYAYVVAKDHFLPDVDGGLRIVDISNPLSSTLVASYDTPGDPRGVFTVFPYIYVADQDSLQILEHIIVGVEEDGKILQPKIDIYYLEQNYPNPFHQSTMIRYQLPRSNHTTIKIYDISGRLIKTLVDEKQIAGYYTIQWDGRDKSGNKASSGIYFTRIVARFGQSIKFTSTQKTILLK
jgi:hypothetical protein